MRIDPIKALIAIVCIAVGASASRDHTEQSAWGMFFFTTLYLFLIFAALLLDKTIYFPLDRPIG